MIRRVGVGLVTGLLVAGCSMGAEPASSAPEGEWSSYGGNLAGQKYSPLDQIDAGNVGDLRIAWRQSAIPMAVRQGRTDLAVPSDYQHTPLMVGGLLYMRTGIGAVAALDATTGEVVWFDREADDASGQGRGVAYWTDGSDQRILALNGTYLVALHARTGERYAAFGDGGRVDLTQYDERPGTPVGGFGWTSPPLVVGDVVVIGGVARPEPGDPPGPRKEAPPGDIRGYDVRTGERLWTFHVVPRPGEYGYDTWVNGSADYSGHAGTWTWMSADETLGYVYVATEEATNDFYGGDRPGDNLFSNSVLCLDARTGERIWHFQTMRHGLWDWDLPTAPILVDITVDGRPIEAVVQLTKQAFAFVLDRRTGEPVWPIEDRPVPQGDVPGESYASTQPFPTRPPAYERQGLTIDDLIDFTPELRAQAVEVLSQYRYGPIYTPVSADRATVLVPGTVGGSNWNGGGFDPDTGLLYVPSAHLPTIVELVKPPDPESTVPFVRRRSGSLEDNLELPGGLPIVKPPYGSIVAIDLNAGDIAWTVPNGDGPRNHPALQHLDLPPLGTPGRPSPLVTKTLLFIGEGMGLGVPRVPEYAGGNMFRAFDKATGRVIWEMELPGGVTGAPMTYLAGGRQYIVVAVGSADTPAELVALALP